MHSHGVSKRTVRARLPGLVRVLGRYGVKRHSLVNLAKDDGMTGERARLRIKTMQDAGVPVKGLTNKLGMSESRFNAFIKRQKGPHKFTAGQESVYLFLRGKGISEETALKLAKTPSVRLKHYQAKIGFFESFKLDPKKFGTPSIPPEAYEKFIGLPLNILKKGLKRKILNPLEDAHSLKKLNILFPEWRKSRLLMHSIQTKEIRITAILARVNACLSVGIKPTIDLVSHYSTRNIVAKGLSLKNAVPLERTAMQDVSARMNETYQQASEKFMRDNRIQNPALFRNMVKAYRENFGDRVVLNADVVANKLSSIKDGYRPLPYTVLYRFATWAPFYWHEITERKKVSNEATASKQN